MEVFFRMSKDDLIIADISTIIVRIRRACEILKQFIALPSNSELVKDLFIELMQENASHEYLKQLESDNHLNIVVMERLKLLNCLMERYSEYVTSLDCFSNLSAEIILITENWEQKWGDRPLSPEHKGILEALKKYQQADGKRVWVGIEDDIQLLEQTKDELLDLDEPGIKNAADVLKEAIVKLKEFKDEEYM
jgi:hypothetical protein